MASGKPGKRLNDGEDERSIVDVPRFSLSFLFGLEMSEIDEAGELPLFKELLPIWGMFLLKV